MGSIEFLIVTQLVNCLQYKEYLTYCLNYNKKHHLITFINKNRCDPLAWMRCRMPP